MHSVLIGMQPCSPSGAANSRYVSTLARPVPEAFVNDEVLDTFTQVLWMQLVVPRKQVTWHKIGTASNAADMGTKMLAWNRHCRVHQFNLVHVRVWKLLTRT